LTRPAKLHRVNLEDFILASRETSPVELTLGVQDGRNFPRCGAFSRRSIPAGEPWQEIDIGKRSPAFPVTPPYVRVRIRRFGGLSDYRTVNLGIPSESK